MKKLQVTVSDELAERIEKMASRYGSQVSPFCAIILGMGMDGFGFSRPNDFHVPWFAKDPQVEEVEPCMSK